VRGFGGAIGDAGCATDSGGGGGGGSSGGSGAILRDPRPSRPAAVRPRSAVAPDSLVPLLGARALPAMYLSAGTQMSAQMITATTTAPIPSAHFTLLMAASP
jgi:hypothetical protein